MMDSFLRTVFLYSVLIVVIRLLGKRQIGQMEPSEFVVTMLVANLATIPMEEPGIPLTEALIPIGTVVILEIALAFLSMKSIRLRKLLCGKPVILIENGKLLQENLRRCRLTMDELTGHLREKDVLDLQSVQYAILETNGNLSVFPFPEARPASAADAGVTPGAQFLPLTVVSDGIVIQSNLKKAGKDQAWLQKTLKAHKATLQETWLLTVDGSNRVVFYRKER